MSVNPPPNPNVATFNNLYWTPDEGFDTAAGDLRYLRFPTAQGTETLQAVNVNGAADFNSTVNVDGVATFNGNVNFNTAYSGGTPVNTLTINDTFTTTGPINLTNPTGTRLYFNDLLATYYRKVTYEDDATFNAPGIFNSGLDMGGTSITETNSISSVNNLPLYLAGLGTGAVIFTQNSNTKMTIGSTNISFVDTPVVGCLSFTSKNNTDMTLAGLGTGAVILSSGGSNKLGATNSGVTLIGSPIYDVGSVAGLNDTPIEIKGVGTGVVNLSTSNITRLSITTASILASLGLNLQANNITNVGVISGEANEDFDISSLSTGTLNLNTGGTNRINITSSGDFASSCKNFSVSGTLNSNVKVRLGSNFTGGLSQGNGSVSIGGGCGTTQLIDCVAIGNVAGINQADNAIAIGNNAAGIAGQQGADSIAIGSNCASNTQSTQSVSIGAFAGQTTQGTQSVAVGYNAGNSSQGANSVAIGYNTVTAANSVAIGSGSTTAGSASVAVGRNSVASSSGNSIAIGDTAKGGTNGVSIGTNAGGSTPNASSVAIGVGAGSNISNGSICIGFNASTSAGGNLTTNSIFIGNAAVSTTAIANSIVLNSTGTAINPSTASAFYVNPVRNTGNVGLAPMYYNTTTKEIGYDSSARRFKKDIEDFVVDTSVLHKFSPKSFKFISHQEDAKTNYGFIAEDLEELNPLLVSYNDEGLTQGINWTTITMFNIGEIQTLRKEVDELKAIVKLLLLK